MRSRANVRVTLRPKPHRHALSTARWYVNGEPVARGFIDETGVHEVILYNAPELFSIDEDTGRVLSHGWA